MSRDGFVRFHESLTSMLVPLEKVSAHPENARNGDVDAIAESIVTNGFIAPVIAQKSTGHIIAGNHRYYALMQLGASQIPVVWIDVTDIEAKRYLLADNRTSDLGNYDNAMLASLLREVESEVSLVGTGYTEFDLEALEHLAKVTAEDLNEFGQWPTLSFQVPPHVLKAFKEMTVEAQDDREAFELLLRLAGADL